MAFTREEYKLGIDVITHPEHPSPPGGGGDLVIDNFKTIANLLEEIINGGGQSFTHEQNVAASTWTITHNLGRPVAVTVVDSAGTEVYGEVTHIGDNQVIIQFSAGFGGKAYCT